MVTETQYAKTGSVGGVTGTLSGPGAQLIHAGVYIGPVPQSPPPGLVDAVSPVFGAAGDVRDWRLAPGHAVPDATLTKFVEWREGFIIERFLAEGALISALMAWADPAHRLHALHALRCPGAQLTMRSVLQLKWEVDEVAGRCYASDVAGLGIVTTPGSHSPVRAILPADAAITMLAAGNSRVVAAGNQLVLQAPGADDAELRSWSVTNGTVAIKADSGADLLYPLNSETGAIVSLLGRRAPRAELGPMPVRTLLAPLLIALHEVANLAGHPDAALYVRSSGG